jgi:hypothetical protein
LNEGKTIPNVSFFNFYVGGAGAWAPSDINSIGAALSAAMSDPNLNNVLRQYFSTDINSTFLGSQILPDSPPAVVSR